MNDQMDQELAGDRAVREAYQLEWVVRDRSFGRVRDLHLEVYNEGVILRGRAPSFFAKQLAQHAVMEASPLPILANEIVVC